MGKKLKRFFALLLATCLTMSTVSVSSAAGSWQDTPLAPSETQFAESKTAQWTDDTKEYADVTLKVGGDSHGSVDVVVLLGGGMQGNRRTVDSAIKIFENVMKSDTSTVKLGLISLEKGQEIIVDLNSPEAVLDPETYDEFITEKFEYINNLPYGTTNLHSQLVEAKKMLDADTTVKPENKYMFVIATGRTYWFDDRNENQAMIVGKTGKLKNGEGGTENFYYYGAYTWQSLRGGHTSLYVVPNNNWDAYWTNVCKWVEADGDKYVYSPLFDKNDNEAYEKWYAKNSKDWRDLYNNGSGTRYGAVIINPKPTAANFIDGAVNGLPYGENNHAMNYERAQYESAKAYEALVDAGYNCYALCSETVYYQNDSIWMNSKGKSGLQLGHSFMNYLATLGGQEEAPILWDYEYDSNGEWTGGEVLDENFFIPVAEDILYTCSNGSTVVDYIGKNENGNFEFIENVEYLKLNVGGVDYTCAPAEAAKHIDESGEIAKSSYSFTSTAEGTTEPTFWLDYYYGDGKETERFVWTFGQTIYKNAPVSLTYRLKLEDKQEMPGTYTVFTNQYAVFNPVDSDGNTSQPELFERPELQYEVEGVNISAKKVWNDDKDRDGIRPEGIEIRLFIENQEDLGLGENENIDSINNTDIVEQVTLNAGNNWKYNWSNLRKFLGGKEIIYVVKEVNVPDNYEYESNYVPGETVVTDFVLTNTHELEKTKVSVKKEWVDANNQDGIRPQTVKVQLKANGKPQGDPVVLSGDEWQYTWENLLKNEAGKAIEYTVEEVDVPAGYTPTITGDAENGYTITNTHTPAVINIAVTKEWDDKDNVDNIRPTEVTVQLYEVYEGKETASGVPVTLNVANNWSYEWTELTKYRVGKEGELVVYEVKEVGTHEFYNENDNEPKIEKKVTETTNSFTITNTHTPFETEVTVTKEWNDKDNQDGIRPADIQIQLYADGAAKGNAVTLNADNNWTHTWTELPVNKKGENGENGIAIEYTVDELGTDKLKEIGYTKEEEITGDAENGYTITNTHTPAETQVTVTKVWEDAENQDNLRPTEITVQLYAGEKAEGKAVTLNVANNWTYTWTELPVNAAGKEIAYTVKETNVTNGYTPTTEVTGDAVNGYTVTITNTHTPAVITVDVTKVWKDGENVDNIRPTEVTVELYADDVAQGDPVTLNAANDWTHEWKDLTKYRVGKVGELVVYEVKEVKVPDNYKDTTDKKVTDTTNSFTITNTHKPFETEVKVTKVWEDDNNRDNVRPNEIQVQLYKDRTAKGEAVTLNKDNNWTYTWTELPVNKKGENGENGIAIEYTVDELGTEELAEIGYTKEPIEGDAATGFTITNTREIDKTEVSVQKKWDDNNDKFKLRPDSIQVQLYKFNDAGKMVPVQDAVTLDATNGWKHTFTDLPVNEKGKEGVAIRYTVKEVQTPEFYESTLSGTAKDGFTITNKLLRTTLTLTKRIDQTNPETATAIFRYLITGPENYRANVTINFENGTVKVDGVVQSPDDDLRDNIGFDEKGLTVTLENLQSGEYTITEYAARGYQLVQRADEDKEAPKASATAINGVQEKFKVTTTVDNPAEVYYWNRYKAPNDYTAVNRFSVNADGSLGISIKRK